MATLATSSQRVAIAPKFGNGDEFLHGIGDVPMSRVVFDPWPGTATEQDLLDQANRGDRICELIDGTLVEKALGYFESLLAMWLSFYLHEYLEINPIGVIGGEQGALRLRSNRIRMPDISFISNARLVGHKLSEEPLPAISPDLAVEVFSEGNTAAEMTKKRNEYFESGTILVWIVYARSRTIEVFESSSEQPVQILNQHDILEGGQVLPGFTLELTKLFAKLPS